MRGQWEHQVASHKQTHLGVFFFTFFFLKVKMSLFFFLFVSIHHTIHTVQNPLNCHCVPLLEGREHEHSILNKTPKGLHTQSTRTRTFTRMGRDGHIEFNASQNCLVMYKKLHLKKKKQKTKTTKKNKHTETFFSYITNKRFSPLRLFWSAEEYNIRGHT